MVTNCAVGRTPLHWAVFYGRTSTVETLLAHGADVNSKDMEGKSTPLRMAAVIGYVDIVKLLLRHQPDLNATDWEGKTALERAEYSSDSTWWKARVPDKTMPDTKKWLEIVELLRASGAK